MVKTDKTPLWVFLAFASIETRKGALILIWISLLFTLYCIPWSLYVAHPWISKIFLIDDWNWFAMMVPIIIWYWLGLRWADKHGAF